MTSFLSHLECSGCRLRLEAGRLHGFCPGCSRPLLARYELRRGFSPRELSGRPFGLWRYRELLPPAGGAGVVTLGEGGTPLLEARRIGARIGLPRLLLKDEGRNPTGSFKARGMAVAVTMARHLGARRLFAPSAGNAGVALAAYGARAGIPVVLAFPEGTPSVVVERSRDLGAEVHLVPGSIVEAGRWIREREGREGFDLSTFREPYRLEGKKTMGFELFEQMEGRLPDAILYPLGGGTGLVALEKAFDEMEGLGWVGKERPRLYAVQASGCAPLAEAFRKGLEAAAPVGDPRTAAHGLRVPSTLADFLILRAVRRSGGGILAVSEEEIQEGVSLLAREEGLAVSPEAGATVAAARNLQGSKTLRPDERVVLFLTAAASVY